MPDIPINEAVASSSCLSFLSHFLSYRRLTIDTAKHAAYCRAASIFCTTWVAEAATPDMPIKAEAANFIISFIFGPFIVINKVH